MWIFTVDGFYSAVQDRKNEGIMMVRSRKREDLEQMLLRLNRSEIWPAVTITDTPGTDYAHRIFMPREYWDAYVSLASQAIDYSNFKAAAVGNTGARHVAYFRTWEAMKDFQDGKYQRPRPWTLYDDMDLDTGEIFLNSDDYQPGDQYQLDLTSLATEGKKTASQPEFVEVENVVAPAVLTMAQALVDQYATAEEVADRLAETFNVDDLAQAAQATNDIVLLPLIEYTLYKQGA